MTERQSFGALLKQHRRSSKLSQEQLAERAGVSTDAISALERGTRQTPYPDTVRSLALALGLSPDDRRVLEEAVVRSRHTSEPREAFGAATLPQPLTPLVGREREVADVLALLLDASRRLLTLLGPGGVGKTRLALRVAEEALVHVPDGVAFVQLAPLSDPTLVVPTIGHALGARGRMDNSQDLAVVIGDKRCLLVLDNFEHLISAAPVVAALLSACPYLRIFVTSRATLRIRGECVYIVPPLQTPNPGAALPADELCGVPACRLFLQRAQAAIPEFAVTAANSEAIAAICHHLEGLPLALELAAARLTVLSPQLLLQRLERRLPLLTGGDRDLPERQQTLYATLAWSYALLSGGEQRLFRQISAFVGGCTIEAIEAIQPSDEREIEPVVDRLGALIEKSLVQRECDADEPRFTMLEIIREYGLEQLAAEHEEHGIRRAHAAYYHDLARQAEASLTGPDQVAWSERLEAEHANVRAAMDWLHETGDLPTCLELAQALWRFWSTRGHMTEGRARLEALLDAARAETIPACLHAHAHFAAGALAYGQGDHAAALMHWQQALPLYRGEADQAGLASTLNGMGIVYSETGSYTRARACLDESIALYQQLGDTLRLTVPQSNLANVLRYEGDYAAALSLYEKCLVSDRASGSRQSEASTLDNLAQIADEMGDYERAETLGQTGLALMRDLKDRAGAAHILVTLGCTALDSGDLAVAEERFRDALDIYRSLDSEALEVYPLQNLGLIAVRQGNIERARVLSERALKISRKHDDKRALAYVLHTLGEIRTAEGELEDASLLYREALGINEALGFPLGVAESRERCAHVALCVGNLREAASLYSSAANLRNQIGSPVPVVDRATVEGDMAHLRHILGDSAADNAGNA